MAQRFSKGEGIPAILLEFDAFPLACSLGGCRTCQSKEEIPLTDPVLEAVNASNQRGGRMLSVVDLLEAGTLSMPQAAHLVARIEAGASWLIGARPGGAGKTTIMSALLAMLPPNEPVWIAGADSRWESARPGECIVACEISPGPFHGYIWGGMVRQMAQRGMEGCRLVANLHADTVAEARQQIVADCGAAEEGFRAFDLFLPITLQSTGAGWERRVEQIWEARNGTWAEWVPAGTLPPREREIAHFLADCTANNLRTVEQVRQAWLARGTGPGR